jgi:putative ABC transport system permease protein
MASIDNTITTPPVGLPGRHLVSRDHARFMLLVAAAAACALALFLAGGRAADSTWQRTFEATNGPHVRVSALPGVDLAPVARIPEVTAASGPFPGLSTSVRHHGSEVGTWLEGRTRAPSAVDHPLIVSGSWLRPGAIVLERSLARAIAAGVGDRVAVAGTHGPTSLTVAGIAETTVSARGPGSRGGLGYVLPGTLRRIVPNANTFGTTLMLRISDPKRSGDVVRAIETSYPRVQVTTDDWSQLRARNAP